MSSHLAAQEAYASGFSLDAVNLWLSGSDTTGLYECMLAISAGDHPGASSSLSQFASRCRGYLAELRRRRGDLTAARAAHQSVLQEQEAAKDYRSVARTWYEVGYIDLLEDRLDDAIEHFEESVRTAEEVGDQTGVWIGRCVAAQAQFFAGQVSNEQFAAALREARVAFESLLAGSAEPRAARWARLNNPARLFELAFAREDTNEASILAEYLQDAPWPPSELAKAEALTLIAARMAMLEDNWPAAVGHFRRYLGPAPEMRSQTEELAHTYLDLGKALLETGDREAAAAAWQSGLALPGGWGNRVWQRRIRTSLEEHGIVASE